MKILGTGVASGQDAGFLIDAMRRLDLFAPLNDEQLRKVLYFVKSVAFEAGETVFEKGDGGGSFYVIREGRMEARVSGFFGSSKTIASMGPGEFFGELALLLKQPRSATVVCVEDSSCFALDSADLETLMERNADVAEAIKSVAKQRFERRL